jgi:hypothetical protein
LLTGGISAPNLLDAAHIRPGTEEQMAESTSPSFSVIAKGEAWFWCSLSLMKNDELIGPFPSEEEAEKDARATLGLGDGEI